MKNRFLLCLFTIVLVLALSIGLVFVRRAVVIVKLTNLSEKTVQNNENNFYFKVLSQSTEFDHFTEKEVFVKEGKYKVCETLFSREKEDITKITTYDVDKDKIRTIETDDYKVYSKYDGDLNPKLNVYTGSLKDVLDTGVRKIKLNDIDCYVLTDDMHEYYINAENGLIVKEIYLDNNSSYEFEYVFGSVDDDDLAKPDLGEFELLEE